MIVVVDASVVLDLLLRTGAWETVAERVPKWTLHAPELLDVEVLQVLRRYRLHEGLARSRAAEAIADFSALRIQRHRHALYRGRIWELHQNLSADDAAYVALAEGFRATLITRDARLARTRGHNARIELLA